MLLCGRLSRELRTIVVISFRHKKFVILVQRVGLYVTFGAFSSPVLHLWCFDCSLASGFGKYIQLVKKTVLHNLTTGYLVTFGRLLVLADQDKRRKYLLRCMHKLASLFHHDILNVVKYFVSEVVAVVEMVTEKRLMSLFLGHHVFQLL